MRNFCVLGLMGILLVLSGCVSYSATKVDVDHEEQVDLYLSTLDDKHFVWCELDLAQCRRDFEKWKRTSRGRMIIREYEKADTGQTFNTHPVPNVFRTHFVDESRLAGEGGVFFDANGKTHSYPDYYQNLLQDRRGEYPQLYGPEVPSKFGPHN